MAKSTLKKIKAQTDALIAGAASLSPGNYSHSSSVSNSGERSTSTQSSGATGAVHNTTVIRVQGDPGYQLGQDSEVITKHRKMFGL